MNDLTSTLLRSKVYQAEAVMKTLPQVDMPVTHHFSEGVYARELFIPKDTILTGKIHKFSQLNILSQGEISVLTEDGVKRVKAPFHIVSPPGTKRIAYAHEDCVWTTIHGTYERDVDKIEEHFIAQSEAEYLQFRSLLLERIEDKSCLG
jgi:hypothetical protein